MFVRIKPELVDKYKGTITKACKACIKGLDERGLDGIFNGLKGGELQCWFDVVDKTVMSIAILNPSEDKFTGIRLMMAYSVYIFRPYNNGGFKKFQEGLSKISKINHCSGVAVISALGVIDAN